MTMRPLHIIILILIHPSLTVTCAAVLILPSILNSRDPSTVKAALIQWSASPDERTGFMPNSTLQSSGDEF